MPEHSNMQDEVQTTNEPLETPEEELRSVSDELPTVNHEFASRVDELHPSNADLRPLFESMQIAAVFLDERMFVRSFTPAVTAILHIRSSDCGRPITDIAHELEGVDLHGDIQKVMDERKPVERSVRLDRGGVFHLMRILPCRTFDDRDEGVVITFVDVTAVMAAEKQQRLLVAELNHRVRNMLQVVIGLGNQTLRRSADLKEFETMFMGRMQALARAYELLSRDGWRSVPLADLVRTQLSAFASEGGRYSAEGESVDLTSNAALALGMVLYELATNATKYGALSTADGRVALTWKLQRKDQESRELVMRWVESGGPPVNEPTRNGFGSELVKRQLQYELRGRADMEFHESGLHATLTVPATAAIVVERRQDHGIHRRLAERVSVL